MNSYVFTSVFLHWWWTRHFYPLCTRRSLAYLGIEVSLHLFDFVVYTVPECSMQLGIAFVAGEIAKGCFYVGGCAFLPKFQCISCQKISLPRQPLVHMHPPAVVTAVADVVKAPLTSQARSNAATCAWADLATQLSWDARSTMRGKVPPSPFWS